MHLNFAYTVTEGVVHSLYKVLTCVVFQCDQLVRWQHKMSGGKWRLSLGDTHLYYSRPNAIQLLFTVSHYVQSVAVCVIPYGNSKPQKI